MSGVSTGWGCVPGQSLPKAWVCLREFLMPSSLGLAWEFLFPKTLRTPHMQPGCVRCVPGANHTRDPTGRGWKRVPGHSAHFSGTGKGAMLNKHKLRPATRIPRPGLLGPRWLNTCTPFSSGGCCWAPGFGKAYRSQAGPLCLSQDVFHTGDVHTSLHWTF